MNFKSINPVFILIVVLSLSANSQKPQSLIDHYNREYKTFREMIAMNIKAEPDTNIDVRFYHLDIEVGVFEPYVGGNVTCLMESLINGLNEIRLDLNSSLTVDSIIGPVNNFQQDGDQLHIYPEQPLNTGDLLELKIYYGGIPVLAGGYKGMRYSQHGSGEPVVATLSTPYLAHYWYPCKDGPSDKPDSVYVDITIPDTTINGNELIAISNGLLKGTSVSDGKQTFEWRHRYPIVTYYVMAVVSNYLLFSENYSGNYGENFLLDYYVFEEHLQSAQQGVADLPAAMDVFSELFGVYPFHEEKYGMTQLGFYGAIENQTNTITNNMSPGWFMISVHELGHMWFGDMITCANWHHGWLNEGFATYSEALYVESQDGHEAYLNYIDDDAYYGSGSLYLENAADTFNVFQPIIYSKGAYVLHMLRGTLGDSVFFESIKNYATDPELMYGQATTEDLQAIMESVAGMSLEFYFDQWIYDENFPVYFYNYQNFPASQKVLISLMQKQEELFNWRPVFEMPVPVKLYFSNGNDTLIKLWNDLKIQTFELSSENEVVDMEIDPEGWLLENKQYDPDIFVSTKENTSMASLQIFPNPADKRIRIHLPVQSQIVGLKLFDMKGSVKYSEPTHAQYPTIDVSGFQKGIYILEAKADGRIYSGKLLVR